MNQDVYKYVKEFKSKYPWTISFRLKKHCKIVENHLNPGETVKFAFAAQKNGSSFDWTSTYVIALTNKRLVLGTKRLLFGYFFTAITPDMFNDLSVRMGLLWGKIEIDTVKENVYLSNIQKGGLDDIETAITEYMMEEKQKYGIQNRETLD